MQPKFKKENKQNHQRYWNHILYPDSMGHVLSIIKLLCFFCGLKALNGMF